MGHTYTNLLTHIIFSTKDRVPYLKAEERDELFAYIVGVAQSLNVQPIKVGGHEDHLHLLLRIPASLALSDVVSKIKSNASRWIHQRGLLHRSFAWQNGYAAFSVSESAVNDVVAYIANQGTHHRKISFQEELVVFLRKNGIEYDERYIWT